MKNEIKILLWVVAMVLVVKPVFSVMGANFLGSGDEAIWVADENGYYKYQTFKGSTGTLDKIMINVTKAGSPAFQLGIQLWSTTGSPTYPNLNLANYTNISIANMTDIFSNVSFLVGNRNIEAGTEYAIVIWSASISPNAPKVRVDWGNSPYTDGHEGKGNINFTGWSGEEVSGADIPFAIFVNESIVLPIVKTSFNITNPIIGSTINYTANITDDIGLLSANWTVNLSTGLVKSNYTLSGLSAQISNTTTFISVGLFNFTIYATDSDNNVAQNSTLISVLDTIYPTINISLNNTALSQGLVVNITGNSSDNVGLDVCKISINQTPNTIEYFNFSLSGTSGFCSQNITIKNVVDNINFTTWVNDTSGNFNQSSLLVTVNDIIPPQIVNFSLQRQPIMNKTQTNIISISCEDTQSYLEWMNFTIRYNNSLSNLTRKINILTGTTYYSGSDFVPQSQIQQLQTKSYIWNYTLFSQSETIKEGIWNITYVGCSDLSTNVALNSSSNNLVGYNFLVDTPPTISSRNPTNSSIIQEDVNVIFNFTSSEDNPSMALLYTNISGQWKLNQTIDYLGDLTTNAFSSLNFTLGTFAWAINLNTTFGTWINSSNFTINFIDNPPVLNTISPANKSTISTTEINISITATETNPDSMILYLSGIINQTLSYVGDGNTLNKFNLNLSNGDIINWSIGLNTTFGTWYNSSNFTFTVDTSSQGGGGTTTISGGGGGGLQSIIINETRIIPESEICNFNNICEATIGEDFTNCGNKQAGLWNIGGDCGFEIAAATRRLTAGFALKFMTVLAVLGVMVFAFSDTKVFKTTKLKIQQTTRKIIPKRMI